jgi:peptidoglycan hydrolase CwlO-like protein
MMDSIGAKWHDCHHVGTIIHVAIDGQYAGHIVINDKIKEDSAEAIAQLKALGVTDDMLVDAIPGQRSYYDANTGAYNDFAKNYSGKILTDSQKKTLEKLEAAVSKAQKRLDEILSQIKDYDSLIEDTDKSLDEYNEATE